MISTQVLARDRGCGGPDAARLKNFRAARVAAFAFFPLADLLLFVLPSLHAHARMALSTRFDYVVAPKVAICKCLAKTPSSSHMLEHMALSAPLETSKTNPQPNYSALEVDEVAALA